MRQITSNLFLSFSKSSHCKNKPKLKLLADGLLISPVGLQARLVFPGHAQCHVAFLIFNQDMEEYLYTNCSQAVVRPVWENGMFCGYYKGTVRTSHGGKT